MVEKEHTSTEIINNKLHTVYFEEYFKELNTQTFVVEYKYIDHDFLEDFSNYYVKCFKNYTRRCIRLHFFSISFSNSDFETLLNGNTSNLNEEILNKSYLGFIVVKPLPQTIIGRTCLKIYGDDNGRRFFHPVRDYEANLFGIRLKVISLAYQEQDTVVAACATSALWSVFNSTGRLFQHQILSPVEISKAACISLPLESRFFPNPGLSPARMAQAIRAIGLEPYLIPANNQEILKSTVYAYLKCKIPMLLGISMIDQSDISKKGLPLENLYKNLHAVAITGFSVGKTDCSSFGKTGLLTVASKIDKLYAHDDQVGPFARMILDSDTLPLESGAKIKTIHTSWIGKDGKIGSIKAFPTILLIPLYNKIRLPFESIQETIIHFDEVIEVFRANRKIPFEDRLVWDIHLTTVNEIKSGMLLSRKWRNSLRLQVLLENMPRFIWRATAFHRTDYILDLLFDATDLEQSSFLFHAVGYHELFFKALIDFSKQPDLPSSLRTSVSWRILEWFSKQSG